MKKTLFLVAALLVLLSGLTGCYRQTFVYPDRGTAAVQEVGVTHLIYGLVTSDPYVKAFEICPTGVAQVDTVVTFGDGFLGCLTAGIYTPNTVVVTCASGTGHNFYLDENDKVVAHEVLDEQGAVVDTRLVSDVL